MKKHYQKETLIEYTNTKKNYHENEIWTEIYNRWTKRNKKIVAGSKWSISLEEMS